MKKKQTKKIVLFKETLRHLEENQVEEVKGGFPVTFSCSCYNSCPRSCDC